MLKVKKIKPYNLLSGQIDNDQKDEDIITKPEIYIAEFVLMFLYFIKIRIYFHLYKYIIFLIN